MDIPRLFAVYAEKDLSKWRQVTDHQINHKSFGVGRIVSIQQSNREIIIECLFDQESGQNRKFAPISFEQGFFLQMNVPGETMPFLIDMHNIILENERQRRQEEKRKRLELERELLRKREEKEARKRLEEQLIREIQAEAKRSIIRHMQEVKVKRLIEDANECYDTGNHQHLIDVGAHIALLLGKGVTVQDDMTGVFKKIISAHLSHADVEAALKWINKIDANKYDVSSLKNKLLNIKEQQNGFTLEEIRDHYTLNKLAALHKSLFAYKKALSIYQQSLEFNPHNHITYNGIGGIYKKLGDYGMAIDNYSKGYKIVHNIGSLTGAGAAYRAQQNQDKAIKVYEKALDINPNDSYANNGIGAVYFDLGMYSTGERYFMIAGEPKNLWNLFWEYRCKDQLEPALECLKLILVKVPGDRKATSFLEGLGGRHDNKIVPDFR